MEKHVNFNIKQSNKNAINPEHPLVFIDSAYFLK